MVDLKKQSFFWKDEFCGYIVDIRNWTVHGKIIQNTNKIVLIKCFEYSVKYEYL